MSVYTCIATSANARPSSEFKERNINGAACQIGQTDIIAFAQSGNLPLIQILSADLPAFMEATNTGKVINNGEVFFQSLKGYEYEPTVDGPILRLVNVTPSDAASLKDQGMTLSTEFGGRSVYGKPTITQFAQIVGMANDQGKQSLYNVGEVGPDGYLAWIYAWRGAIFFAELSSAAETGGIGILAKAGDAEETTIPTTGVPTIEGTERVYEDTSGTVAELNTFFLKAEQSVVRAPVYVDNAPEATWTLTATAKSNGYVFPYFHGLVIPDKSTLATSFLRLYSRALGNDSGTVSSRIPIIRNGLRQLSLSRAGQILTHIYFGISLAIDAGAAFHIILHNNVYHGFSLTGDHVRVTQRGRMLNPLVPREISDALSTISMHDAYIAEIVQILNGAPGVNDTDVEIHPEDTQSSRALANLLYAKDLISLASESKERLALLLDKLSFSDRYWDFTPKNLEIVIDAMTSGKWLYPDAPFYLGGRVGMSTNTFVRALAVFGPRAPSVYAGTKVFTIPGDGKEDPNVKVVDKVRNLQYIPMYARPILAAAADWTTVRARSQIAMIPPRGGRKEFANRSKDAGIVSGEDDFNRVYSAIKRFTASKKATEKKAEGKGKKRARDDEDEDAEDREPKRIHLPRLSGMI